MARTFTLEEARALMPRVKAITRPAFELATSLSGELSTLEPGQDPEREESLRERLQTLIERWTEAIQDLGPEVKGLWLVDFDSGDGYWCWAWPEEELAHWHSYEGGFRERVPIEAKPAPRLP